MSTQNQQQPNQPQANPQQPARPAAQAPLRRAPIPARPTPAQLARAALPPAPRDNMEEGVVPPTPSEMRELASNFRTVMEEEIAALDRHDYNALKPLSERKRITASLFKEKQKILMRHGESLKAAPQAERKALADALEQLATVAKRNEIAVRGARDGHQRFLNAVIKGATKLEQLGNGYSRQGRSTTLTSNYGANRPVSLFSDTRC